ncbi:hypothetical protein L1281_002531 [Neisseria sp. HSC-16F19]|nr:DUF2513 domain-containing protein [Neisseria sp. HSC-16F19]MCP2041913.1 hypothetical protein [Neisseria sp. HSC-16F19]
MQRNWELIRKILLKLEEQPEASGYLDSGSIKGFPPETVAYHYSLLHQAGLIRAKDTSTNEGFDMYAQSLTWKGHEFLDDIRNDTTWNRIKGQITEKGLSLTFDTIKAAAAVLIGQLLS